MEEAKRRYFKNTAGQPTVPEIAAYYRERKMACVIFPVDSECATGLHRVPNDEVAELVAQNRDVMIPFASIDPHKGKMGVREARRLIAEYGCAASSSTPRCRPSIPTTAWPIRCTR